MSAAARAAVAGAASDLLAADGAAPRAATLARNMARQPRAPLTVQDLETVPAWLRCSAPEQTRLRHLAALTGIASVLHSSINGAWLRELAERAGADLLDRTTFAPPPVQISPFTGDELGTVSLSILHAATPQRYRAFLPPSQPGVIDGETARQLLECAAERLHA